MLKRRALCWWIVAATLSLHGICAQGPSAGSIRGIVLDADFEAPLPLAEVLLVETGETVSTSDQGGYVFRQVESGTYTLVVSKPGYVRRVRTNVVVVAGRLTDVDFALAGDFTDMEEFVVQDLRLAAGSEAALLNLRFKSPALLDSIGSDMMSRAGAGDAASALKLVTGASVQDGKFAVIRGLPDRYVSSQMNGVRLPSADEDKRAVQLDQFPAAVIESLQVSKTFTPDQQGDASGGAVDVRLKGIPDEPLFQIKAQYSYNSQVENRDDFITYRGGGVDSWARDHSRKIQPEGQSWTGAVGTSRDDAPTDWKTSLAFGGKHVFDNGVRVGAFGSFFYERDSSYDDDGRSDSKWVEIAQSGPNGPLVPEKFQGTTQDGAYKTRLFDVTRGVQSVQWGALTTLGVETEHNDLRLTHLYTRAADDAATLSEDTRGKAHAFPGYDPNDPSDPGNQILDRAPYLRLQTLEYTERSTETLQLAGRHTIPFDFELGPFEFRDPEIDWTLARSSADLDQPDKRQFGSRFEPASFDPGIPPFIPPSTSDPGYFDFKPAANFTVGNLQRTFKQIEEDSVQYFGNVKLPFDQWSGDEGFLKAGFFRDELDRNFKQQSYSNLGETGLGLPNTTFDVFWTDIWPTENHPLSDPETDVDYRGNQDIFALYSMVDLPLSDTFDLIGGARFESTRIGIVNFPENPSVAKYFPPESTAPVDFAPGVADVDFEQNDVLPSIGFAWRPTEEYTVRASYGETVARQTFKELSPIIQQEFLGGPIFIGNPDLQMSGIKNYDLRVEYTPREDSLFSVSAFKKTLDRPIEFVQRAVLFSFTTPVNYPKGELTGYELEARQGLGSYWPELAGLSVGANATFIDSEVQLPQDERKDLADIGYILETRDMTNAPDRLYNLYLTYDFRKTQLAVFYTVQGDTLVSGAGATESNNFVPSVYQTEYGTLNLSASHRFSDHLSLKLQAKNLTNPDVKEVYRGGFEGGDVTKTSFSKGMEFSISLGIDL